MKTIRTAIKHANTPGSALHRALNQLAGCPVGGWPETQQAMTAVSEAIPDARSRAWSREQLLDKVMIKDHADRWQWA
jgi:hypothetical protein